MEIKKEIQTGKNCARLNVGCKILNTIYGNFKDPKTHRMYIICKNIKHIQNKVLVIIYLMQVLKQISLLDPIFLIIFMKILFSSATNVSTSKYQIFKRTVYVRKLKRMQNHKNP